MSAMPDRRAAQRRRSRSSARPERWGGIGSHSTTVDQWKFCILFFVMANIDQSPNSDWSLAIGDSFV
jgi:hypothetical protein